MHIAMISQFYGVIDFSDYVSTCWPYGHQTWGIVLAQMGHTAIEYDIRYLDIDELNKADIIIVPISPFTASTFNRIRHQIKSHIKIIAMETDPAGGMDSDTLMNLGESLVLADNADWFVPLNPDTQQLFAYKLLMLPFGVDTRYIDKFVHLPKLKPATALLFRAIGFANNSSLSMIMLLHSKYRIIVTTLLDRDDPDLQTFRDNNTLTNLFGINKQDILPKVSRDEHTQLIAQSNIICAMTPLASMGSVIGKSAALGVPCVAHRMEYYQRLFYPKLQFSTVSEAKAILANTDLLAEAAAEAKEKACQLCISNPDFWSLVEHKFEEVIDG